MREIKFRAWDKENKEMFYSDDGRGFYFEMSPVAGNSICDLKGNELQDRDFSEWMQYTGLKDKNGKEIYEGDICKGFGFYDEPNDFHKEPQIGVIQYGPGWSFHCKNVNNQCRGGEADITWKLEVIGNIYENPELLK